MLMDYKKFRFALIPDKNNDLIFLKSPRTLLFGPFQPFVPSVFSKDPALSHIPKYEPLTPY